MAEFFQESKEIHGILLPTGLQMVARGGLISEARNETTLITAVLLRAVGCGPIGPSAYLSAADSPFAGLGLSFFVLQDFESGSTATTGATISGTSLSITPAGGTFTDSVDGDDGVIDGSGLNGRSLITPSGITGITVSFVPSVALFGSLPTHAGIVWTDLSGQENVSFEAFDPNGVSLGVLGPFPLNDGVSTGQTAEDRFLGFTNAAGISSFRIYQSGADMEVDHLQFGGAPIPEPATFGLFAVGLAVLAVAARRRA